jgi:hypothetical protein
VEEVDVAKLSGMRPRQKMFSPRATKDIPLGKAHEMGIKVSLGRPPSLESCSLMLVNESKEAVRVEMTGAVLLPQGEDANSYQRLMVAGAEDVTDTGLDIKPGEKKKVTLETCCMDRRKNPPGGEVEYRISEECAPERLVNSARRFVMSKNGDITLPQGSTEDTRKRVVLADVQAACWHGQ